MLAELVAINAAFAVVKETISNGKELAQAGKAISDFVNAKEDLEQKHRKQKASVFGDDFETFMAIEQVRQKEKQLQEWMQLYGRPYLWQDWVKFQAEARKERQRAKAERQRKRDELIETVGIIAIVSVCCILFLAFAYFMVKKKSWL